MSDDLPYRAEYAKSGRASCKGCKNPIAKDTLRLAVMVQVGINTLSFRCSFPPTYFKAIKTHADVRFQVLTAENSNLTSRLLSCDAT
jgi:hypothetical protein